LPALDRSILVLALLIEFGGSLLVVGGCVRGLWAIARSLGSREGLLQARLLIADGAIAALGFKTAATLLKSLELQTWNAILAFATILALRTLVKRVLVWEERRLRAGAPHSAV
jgi:uncharacterized membrane protein